MELYDVAALGEGLIAADRIPGDRTLGSGLLVAPLSMIRVTLGEI